MTGSLTVTATASPGFICTGGSSQLNATASGGYTYSYSWASVPVGFTSTLQNPTVTPTVTTLYIAIVTSDVCTSSDSVTVTVNQSPPTPIITATGDTLISSASSGNQWYFDGTAIPGATNQVLIATQDGYYTVQVTDNNGCVSPMSASYYYSGPEGITAKENSSLSIYPNPSNGIVKLSGTMLTSAYEVSLYNTFGKNINRRKKFKLFIFIRY